MEHIEWNEFVRARKENVIQKDNSDLVSYLIHYNTLLQNAKDIITECDSYFITKRNKSLLQDSLCFLLQNATVYYKKRQLLQNATILLQNVTVITKCVGTI